MKLNLVQSQYFFVAATALLSSLVLSSCKQTRQSEISKNASYRNGTGTAASSDTSGLNSSAPGAGAPSDSAVPIRNLGILVGTGFTHIYRGPIAIPGTQLIVETFDSGAHRQLAFDAYGGVKKGGVNVASGDVNGDGVADIITGSGEGAFTSPLPPLFHFEGLPAEVRVFNGKNGNLIHSFNAYPGFVGGVFVASGDVNGDGRDDIITIPALPGLPHVKVYSGVNLELLQSYFAPGNPFKYGNRVAAGDFDRDGRADIFIARPSQISYLATGAFHYQVDVHSGVNGAVIASIPTFANAMIAPIGKIQATSVAVCDINRDGRIDIVAGNGDSLLVAGNDSQYFDVVRNEVQLKVFDGADTNRVLFSQNPFPGFRGEIRTACGDIDGDGYGDIIVGAGATGGPHIKVYSGRTNAEVLSFFAFDPNFAGGIFVGAYNK